MFPEDMNLYPCGARLLATGDEGGFNWPHPAERAVLADGGSVPVRVLDNDEVMMHGGYVVLVTTATGGTYTTRVGTGDLIPNSVPASVNDVDIASIIAAATEVLDAAGIEDRDEFLALLSQASVESLMAAITLVLNTVRNSDTAPPMSKWRTLDGLWKQAAQMVDAALALQASWMTAGTVQVHGTTRTAVTESLGRVMADLAPQAGRRSAPEPAL